MAPVLLLFFLSTAYGIDWYIGKNVTAQQITAQTSDNSFYGTYGQGLSIFSPGSKSLQLIGKASNLCVVEMSNSSSTSVQKHLKSNSMTTLFQEENVLIVGSEVACSNLELNSDILNVISVPSRPYRPQTPKTFPRPTMPNDAISDALAKVSKENLVAFDEYLSNIHTRNSFSDGAKEAQLWIANEFLKFGYAVSYDNFNPSYSANVIATITGTRFPQECLYVGAHYDSRALNTSSTTERAPGADDNGSGTSAILEMARIVKAENFQFAYSVCFATFSGEEQGLVGSRQLASKLPAGSVLAMLNADMLGYTLPDTPITLGEKDRYVTPQLVDAANQVIRMYIPELPIANSSSCCSDYQSFYENGFPAMGFFENAGAASNYPHYHRSTDLPIYVNFDQVVLHTQAVLASLLTFAQLV